MTPERLRQIEELYHSAREREPGERSSFLAEACRDDEELLREVTSLLAQDSGGPRARPVSLKFVDEFGCRGAANHGRSRPSARLDPLKSGSAA
jgi:hypothetical protein